MEEKIKTNKTDKNFKKKTKKKKNFSFQFQRKKSTILYKNGSLV